MYDAGFTRQLEFWLSPDGHRALSLGDAIAALDSGAIKPTAGVEFPDTGVRALPDELVDRVCPPPTAGTAPPPWLVAQAEVIAEATVEKLKPLIRAEVRAALRAEARKQAAGGGRRDPGRAAERRARSRGMRRTTRQLLCLAGMVPKCVRSDWPPTSSRGRDIDWGPGGYRDPGEGEGRSGCVVAGALTEGNGAGTGRTGRPTRSRSPKAPKVTP